MSEKKTFDLPYAGMFTKGEITFLCGEKGDLSVVLEMQNPVLQYAADSAGYQAFQQLLLHICKLMGHGHILQKQDVFFCDHYVPEKTEDYLQNAFQQHFNGRRFIRMRSYLILTKEVPPGRFYVYDQKGEDDFCRLVLQVRELLSSAGCKGRLLRQEEIKAYLRQILSMEFACQEVALDNIYAQHTHLNIGAKALKSISLVDIESIDLPAQLSGYHCRMEGEGAEGFPQDNMSFLLQLSTQHSLIYNQLIRIPAQQACLNKLELKRKRHSGLKDPANQMCVEDIDRLLMEVARDNRLLVYAHYNILLCAENALLDKATSEIEAALFQLGIIPSRNSYNQLALFRSCLPGNAVSLQHYDWFLLSCEAAICLMCKERLAENEDSSFLVRFTDRQGIPIAIDPSDLPMRTGRISNRSKFVLGGSGSGKSFFMNALIEQYLQYNMDVVIVDTGHSYSGICAYFKGRYLSYSEENPITMNPFLITKEEYNIEKRDFLKTLIALLLRGAEGEITQVEDTVLTNVISAYYLEHFSGDGDPEDLGFDSFYAFSLKAISSILFSEQISFDLDEYRYVLKKFCSGQEFGELLNRSGDVTLFSQRLVVFEIDAIRDHKVLFPIVTLIIMDIFLQKMRLRSQQRKALILEEAWKSIASPLMASYLLYMYKTVRKFWGEAIVVTQELGDIIGNAIVKDSIISNSDTICLLDQGKLKGNYAQITSLLSLTEQEKHKIFTINQLNNKKGRGRFKEVYIRRGLSGEVYGVEVSLRQYLTFSTEKPEKLLVEHYVAKYGSYRAGLDALIAELEDSGCALEEFIARAR